MLSVRTIYYSAFSIQHSPPPELPMKLLLKLVVVLLVVVVAGVVLAIWSIDRIAKAGIERGATYALGVPVTLDGAKVGILKGTFEMENLTVGNPSGYRTEHFLRLGDGGVAVTLATLRQEVVTLPTLRLEDISINLEKSGGKANYAVITDNLKRFESDPSKAPSGDDDGTRFIVNELAIRDVKIHVDLLPVGGELTRANLAIDEIILRDIGSDTDRGVLMGELASIIVKAILQVAADKGGGIIPADILGDLNSRLAQLGDLGSITSKLGDQVEGIRGAIEGAAGGLEDAARGITDGVEKGLEGLGDRFRPR